MTGEHAVGQNCSETRQHRHKTLSAYYPRLQTLKDYLLSAPGSSRPRVVLEKDPDEYKRLVRETLCAIPGYEVSCPPCGTCDAIGTQQELIDGIIGEISRRSLSKDVKDVLIAGDKYAVIDLPVNVARAGSTGRSGAGPTAMLRSRPWRILRSRVGDEVIRHLLLHTSIFLPVGNNCYMQLSGEPIYEKYQHEPTRQVGKKRSPEDEAQSSRKRRKKRNVSGGGTAQEAFVITAKDKQSPVSHNITRQKLFYAQPARRPNGSLIYGLPPQQILNKLSVTSDGLPSDAVCFGLLQAIFPSMSSTSAIVGQPRLQGSRARVPGMMGAMRELLVRHSRLDIGRHLRALLHRVHSEPPDHSLRIVSHDQVCRLVSRILKEAFGPSILGGQENMATIVKHARRLVRAKQFETLSLHSLAQGISVDRFYWLQTDDNARPTPQESQKRRRLVLDLVRWIFEDYLIPLLRNTFYVTETAATRYQTVYFAHEDWSNATKPHFESLQLDFLKELDSDQKHFAHQGPLGVSAVRLIPKPNGFRPIVNLGRKIRGQAALGISTTDAKLKSANQILRTVHQVLTYEKERKRDQLGSCLFGTNEVFAPLQALKAELTGLHGKLPRLFFVKMDIKAAFDTIKQDRIMDIITSFLDKDHDYYLMLYCLLLPPASKASQGSARRLFKQRAILDDGASLGFDDHASDISKPLRNAVLVDMARRRHVTRDSCLQLLRTHIKHNVWQIGSKLYRQKEGIPQGSKISSLLCSIFYAALEAQYLPFVHRPGSRLLRYIDDFLFVSDDLDVARRFIDAMRGGFPEYGAFISPSKTLLSFEHRMLPVAQLSDGALFPFCGFLIDLTTLDISMDHPRVLGGPIQQSFALRSNRRKGSAFVGWLSRQLENRNHIAYLDTQHNALDTVHFNIFLNFAITAMKVPSYLHLELVTARRAESIVHSLCLAAEYTYVAGRARVKHASRNDTGQEHYGVRKADFLHLAKMAMLKVLSKKASRMKIVVDLLSRDVGRSSRVGRAKSLEAVIDKGIAAIEGARY